MSGALLVGFFILGIIFLIISRIDSYNDEEWRTAALVSFVIGVIFILAIPASRIDSKQNVEYAKVFQETLDYNRANQDEFNVFERTAIIDEVNNCNSHINKWRVKGQKWYYNKWYLHPDTQTAEFIK